LMRRKTLEEFMTGRRCTLLGVGPMSPNCVDATIELANEYDVPLILIASRRQIEAEEFGGGYVNGWSTERFADYVRSKDRKKKIILARDHGGPWQNDFEKDGKFDFSRAMNSAKRSFEVDITSGFEIVHIDASRDLFQDLTVNETLSRIYELYEFCWSVARRNKTDILFEIGTEEQTGSNRNQFDTEYVVSETKRFCKKNAFPDPAFVVVQTGTKVLETRNVGTFDSSPFRIQHELPAEIQVPKSLDMCNRHGIFLKQHNTDYLSDAALEWHPKLGIHAANVAPEFGVTETRAFLEILEENGMKELADRFVKLAFESGKWKKWMLPGTTAGKREKAVIAGHYVFAHPECLEIKECAITKLRTRKMDLDEVLKEKVKLSIMRYLKNFRLVRR